MNRIKPNFTGEHRSYHLFGFPRKHTTTEQTHQVADVVTNIIEKKELCAAAFLNVQLLSDEVGHVKL